MPANNHKYFLYSHQYFKERNEIESKMDRVFMCGTVVVNGTLKEFDILSDVPEIKKYPDVRIIAEGDIETMKYTKPSIVQRRS